MNKSVLYYFLYEYRKTICEMYLTKLGEEKSNKLNARLFANMQRNVTCHLLGKKTDL